MTEKRVIYVITPNDLTNEPIDIPEEEAIKYIESISEELASFISTIQFGLNFFGVQARIDENHKNQINYYDSNNKLLRSMKIQPPKVKRELLDIYAKKQFNDKFNADFGNIRWNINIIDSEGENSENYYFNLDCENHSKTIRIYRRQGKIVGIEAQINGQKDFNIKNLEVSEIKGERINIELDNVFGPDGDHENGIVRRIVYSKSSLDKDISIYVHIGEDYAHKNSRLLYASYTCSGGIESDNITLWNNQERTTERLSDYDDPINNIDKILSHPRSKETISYLEKEIDREFPGMMHFIKTNLSVYNKITGLSYEQDPHFEELINSTILTECDFPKEAGTNNKINVYKKQIN